jgi:hypothetical protein
LALHMEKEHDAAPPQITLRLFNSWCSSNCTRQSWVDCFSVLSFPWVHHRIKSLNSLKYSGGALVCSWTRYESCRTGVAQGLKLFKLRSHNEGKAKTRDFDGTL